LAKHKDIKVHLQQLFSGDWEEFQAKHLFVGVDASSNFVLIYGHITSFV
jgi:hypothetical protein